MDSVLSALLLYLNLRKNHILGPCAQTLNKRKEPNAHAATGEGSALARGTERSGAAQTPAESLTQRAYTHRKRKRLGSITFARFCFFFSFCKNWSSFLWRVREDGIQDLLQKIINTAVRGRMSDR